MVARRWVMMSVVRPRMSFRYGLHDGVLGARIQRAGRLVEQEDRRVFEESARDADALALADAEVAAALSHRAFESLRHSHDKVIGLRALGSFDDLLISRAGSTVSDVFLDSRGKKHGILQDHPDLCAKRFLSQLAHIAAIEKDPAGHRIIEARDEAQQRALARSGATHKCHAFAVRDRKVDVFQDETVMGIAEADVAELDIATRIGDRLGVRSVWHVVLAIEHLEATRCARGRALQCPGRVAELLERLVKHEQIGGEDRQVSERERAGQDLPCADVIHEGGARSHERAHNKRADD